MEMFCLTILVSVSSLNYVFVTGDEFDIPLAQDRSGIKWYVPGAPQAAEGAPNPTLPPLTIPTPNMSDTAIPTHETGSPVGNIVLPTQANNGTTNASATVAPPAANVESLISTTALPQTSNETTTAANVTVAPPVANVESTISTTVPPQTNNETISTATAPPAPSPPPPGGLLDGVESLLWGKPSPAPSPNTTDPDANNNTTLMPMNPKV
ncbi:hypothetical protein WDU94_010882 [Cyamophila willieti]